MPEASVSESLSRARDRLEAALSAAGRPADSARLLAVSKTKPANMLRQAYAAGQRAFGENYLQEALEKQQALADLDDIEWHFIGALQSNKTRDVAEHFNWVHGIDREKIARRLSEQRPPALGPIDLCLQLNVSGEASKAGVDIDDLPALAESLLALPNIRLRGLMALPAPSDDRDRQRHAFRQVAVALAELQRRFPEATLDTLSMGMSGDLEAAVLEGATIVRLGTAIFGSRPPRGS
ncbi:YggS family pyridoxal phosphate-dependent enzyme [Salinicola acroporae]|uniref:Pyridoxal phosphate homeostasis protein n=1 Tax=Salinicola acroporae TaxID=1541440 RepID=A0ABT6I0H8_9GAMM|nr:YggS family pyridoxal phosphate-dependent enzyme [Salinicola acroporae]MDH4571202.1 YggS family pyridoxal phosphate-dependent enzyme [Salinicola acroporae]